MSKTLQDYKKERAAQVEGNRALGVLDYKSTEKQTDRVFEIEEGAHSVSLSPALARGDKAINRENRRMGPGHRFRPTVSQVKQFDAGRGGLVGKVRELTQTEYAGVHRHERPIRSTGADIGLRSLKALKGEALSAALAASLDVEDFANLAPRGPGGRYTLEQVNEAIQAKQEA